MRRDCINREMTMEIVVGTFMIMVLMGLAYFTIILSRTALFATTVPVEIVFKHVMGLRVGDTIMARGMPIGKVKSLMLHEDGVHVIGALDVPLEMRSGYRIFVASSSMLGGQHLAIEQGDEDGAIVPDSTLLVGETPYDLMTDAAALVNQIKKGLVEGGVIENLKKVSADFQEMMARVNAGKGTLGRLMSEDDTLYEDLSASVASLRGVTERIDRGEGALGKLMSADDTLYADLAASVRSVRDMTARVENGEGSLGKLLGKDDQLYTDLSAAVGSLKTIAGRIENGEGMLGRLVTDDSLYTNIENIVNEVRAAVDDYRETAPIVTFSSILFGAF